MLDPNLARRLMEIPEMGEFIKHLAAEADRINHFSDIPGPVEHIGVEVRARQIAYEKVCEILAPLINVDFKRSPPLSREYMVETEDLPK